MRSIGPTNSDWLSCAVAGGAVEELILELGSRLPRGDTAANAGAYVSSVAEHPEGLLNLKTLARLNARREREDYNRFRNLLEGRGLDAVAVRRVSVAAAAGREIHALALELTETGPSEKSRWLVISLSALGPGWYMPLGHKRQTVSSTETGFQVPTFGQLECSMALKLIDDLRADCEAIGIPGPILPPIVASDITFAQEEMLRAELERRRIEFVGPVSSDCVEHGRLEMDPYEPVTADELPVPAASSLPGPRPLLRDGRRSGQFMLAKERDGVREWQIAIPQIEERPAALTGRRLHRRAEELGELAAKVVMPEAATRLRIRDLSHRHAGAFERHAALLSLLQAIFVGQSNQGVV